jgi:hypothetical protein
LHLFLPVSLSHSVSKQLTFPSFCFLGLSYHALPRG